MGTTQASYVVGDLIGVVGRRAAVLLAAPADDPLVSQIWSMIIAGDGPTAMIGALAGGGLDRLPEFALACHDGDRTVLLARGAVGVSVGHGDGSRSDVTAVGVLTWAERVVTDVVTVTLHAGDAPTGVMLPLVAGVVRAASITLAPTGSEVAPAAELPAAPPAALPAVEPRPAPAPVPAAAPTQPAPVPAAAPTLPAPAPAVVGREPDRPARTSPFASPLRRLEVGRPEQTAQWGGVERQQSPFPGDHDGHTVARVSPGRSGTGALRPEMSQQSAVYAIACPRGHQNQPIAASCRRCGEQLDPNQVPFPVDRLVLGSLRIAGGPTVALDCPLIVFGREPRAARRDARLVQLAGAGGLSRIHAEFRVEEWTVEVVDRSTNGTRVTNPNQDPVRVASGRPMTILPGALIELAEEVAIRYDTDADGCSDASVGSGGDAGSPGVRA